MPVYRVKTSEQPRYEDSIGTLIFNAAYPCIPGIVGNATTFDFPVRYKVVKEASIHDPIRSHHLGSAAVSGRHVTVMHPRPVAGERKTLILIVGPLFLMVNQAI